MCTISIRIKTHYPSEIIEHRVKCYRIIIDTSLWKSRPDFRKEMLGQVGSVYCTLSIDIRCFFFSTEVIHSSVVTDSLIARTARIDDLVFCSMSNCSQMQLSTPNADIAYHLKFKDDEIGRELQEGDVVGFFTDEEDGGTYVKLLQSGDAHKAIHAGVISRSWYLAANRMAQQGGFDQPSSLQALKRIS